MTLKNKAIEEKRKPRRFECLIPSEVLGLEDKHSLVERATIHDFSSDGLKLVIKYADPVPGSRVKLKLYIPEKQLITRLVGEVVWSKHTGNRLEVGLKINQINTQAKEEILAWIVPKWLENESIKEKEKRNILSALIKKF